MSGPRRMKRPVALAYYPIVGLVTALIAVPILHLLHAHLGIPFDYSGDALSVGVHVKNVLEHGWIDSNPYVGAPWGRHGNDFPGADNLHLMVASALGLLSSSYAVVLNACFLLTFPLAAVAAAWFFRVLGIGRVVSLVLAVLFAFAPYHFYRGEGHLFLAGYYPVPLAAVLIYRALAGESLWSRHLDVRGRRPSWLTTRNAGTALSLVVLGTASSYYSTFTLLFLTFAGLLAVVQDRRWKRVLGVVSAQVLLVAVMLANMLPNLLYERAHGQNVVALVRKPLFTEIYDFKLSSLLLPWPGHRLVGLADYREGYDRTFPLPSERPALGLIAAVGLLFLLVVVLGGAVRGSRRLDDHFWVTQRRLGVLTLAGFLLGTVGGFSTFFALFVSDSLRGWNRLSIFLAVFCLASVGLLVERLLSRLTSLTPPRAGPVVVGFVSLVLLAVGLFDQTPAAYPVKQASTVTSWESDQHFVDTVQSRLPSGAVIFQLPYMFYPEAKKVVGMRDSDQFRFYLHSSTLRWTYGAIRGRADADWSVLVSAQPVPRMTAMLAAAHIDGIQVFRAGYRDGAAALESALRTVLGVPPLVSPDGKYSFWDTRPFAARLRARSSADLDLVGQHVLLHPVGYPVGFPGSSPYVLLDNGWSSPQPTVVTLTLRAPQDRSDVVVTWPDGASQTLSFAASTARVERHLVLQPGQSVVRLRSTSGARLRPGSVVVADPVLSDFRA